MNELTGNQLLQVFWNFFIVEDQYVFFECFQQIIKTDFAAESIGIGTDVCCE